MPNLLWNPHSFDVPGLCTVFIVTIRTTGTITIPFTSQHRAEKLHSDFGSRLAVGTQLPSSPLDGCLLRR